MLIFLNCVCSLWMFKRMFPLSSVELNVYHQLTIYDCYMKATHVYRIVILIPFLLRQEKTEKIQSPPPLFISRFNQIGLVVESGWTVNQKGRCRCCYGIVVKEEMSGFELESRVDVIDCRWVLMDMIMSSDSSGASDVRRWKKKQLKVNSQKPFKLRTEQRGKHKEEVFVKKVQEMLTKEEKQRIPIAQGRPRRTKGSGRNMNDRDGHMEFTLVNGVICLGVYYKLGLSIATHLIKPPVKYITRPIDLKLHSDVRAVERADFDTQVAEKLSLLAQHRMKKHRQQKLGEEEEVKRLRKELVPRAQPMPYFERPFIPKRSVKFLLFQKNQNIMFPITRELGDMRREEEEGER
ncbi:hypothetical protein C5167_032562 [Papaver somniferum]|uniref:TPX2 C-terminal domain-containing protein n=1 Tax=Papaver somniferum TaxID=3469 RepID=A0A4Y7K981_PAPSO|nr:hypothetical protein C5167_032562 [Papaver somniferum]